MNGGLSQRSRVEQSVLDEARRGHRLHKLARSPRLAIKHSVFWELFKLSDSYVDLLSHEQKDWASISFSGTKHNVRLRFNCAERLAEFARKLPDHDFCIDGQLVADAVASDEGDNTVLATVLLLEEHSQ